MTRYLIAFLIAYTAITANAHTCLGEAQIIATVTTSGPINNGAAPATKCRLSIHSYGIKFYSENGLCPLSIVDVLAKGIVVQANADSCSIEAGQELSGVIILKDDGSIVLENQM